MFFFFTSELFTNTEAHKKLLCCNEKSVKMKIDGFDCRVVVYSNVKEMLKHWRRLRYIADLSRVCRLIIVGVLLIVVS
jgi:hypothetical protein